ncbi:hypothetical protein HOD75_00855 [archaeon]|jgi:hypothetical protein|nr:hypothetical protein [archaeon]MBT4241426.1 hypothetical protein [archaeon]MBT4417703.1 hypothetical protein [archaeon]
MGEIENLIAEVSPYYRGKDGAPSSEHQIVYDSASEGLEPVYFWILDFMNNMFGGSVEKIIDNFASSPGSGHFSELGQKMSQMQQEASRVLATVNTILKGVLNLIYDLKEFKIRLAQYEDANSKDKSTAEAGLLALKQIWMDKVDIQRGQGSINAMASGNLQFVTLRDAFMIAKSPKDVDKMDFNERVKRILKPRIQEFFEWRKRSEQELKKRFEIEKTYLKSQVEALRLNSRWAKPYLKAAEQLSASEKLGSNPALVTVFNTIMLELSIMGKGVVKVEPSIISKDLPADFKKIQKKMRPYYSVVIVDFKFRGIPSKAGQHYVFGGRVEANFKSYALNEDELTLFKEKLDDSDLNSALKLVQGMTDDSLGQIQLDIDEFLGEEKKEKEKDVNPFSALFSGFKLPIKSKKDKDKEKKEKLLKKGAKKDSYPEKFLRSLAEAGAINNCFTVYDIYKKGHGMASFPFTKDAVASAPKTPAEDFFGF